MCCIVQASERIPLTACMPHCSISVLAWVAVACLKGDYRLTQAADSWFGGQQRAMLQAIYSGAATWVRWLHSPCSALHFKAHMQAAFAAHMPSGAQHNCMQVTPCMPCCLHA